MTWTKPSHHLFSLFCLNLDFWPFMHLKMQNSPRSSKSEIKSEVSSAALWSRDAASQLWSAAPGINAIKGFRVWERSGLTTRRCCSSCCSRHANAKRLFGHCRCGTVLTPALPSSESPKSWRTKTATARSSSPLSAGRYGSRWGQRFYHRIHKSMGCSPLALTAKLKIKTWIYAKN